MKNLIIPLLVLLMATGCVSPDARPQVPLTQDALDAFLNGGRDARYYGITIYHDAAGDRFEFANRLHQDRGAEMDFVSLSKLNVPVIKARTGRFIDFNFLLDSSARQNWLLLQTVEAMDYRTFAPATGEYPDHIDTDIPGYAGVANKVVMDTLHVESPIFFVTPATGGLGPLSRANELPEEELELEWVTARNKLANRTHAVMGSALMRKFASIRFDFTVRKVRFSSHKTFRPAAASAVRAQLPMLNWRGRPVVNATLNGEPIQLVVDTGGEFDLSIPGEMEDSIGTLILGNLELDEVEVRSHFELGLPEEFPARIGLGILSDYLLTLDHKQNVVWLEDRITPETEKVTAEGEEDAPAPVMEYRGIRN
jgi:hypothetical protein